MKRGWEDVAWIWDRRSKERNLSSALATGLRAASFTGLGVVGLKGRSDTFQRSGKNSWHLLAL